MAALMVLRPNASVDEPPAINRMAGQLLLLALLTQLVYPLFYDGYLGRRGQMMIILSTVVTAIRNLALVVFTVEACWLAWRMLAVPVPDHAALTRQE
jgi:hypothetical protein